jgi:hypothetical protein
MGGAVTDATIIAAAARWILNYCGDSLVEDFLRAFPEDSYALFHDALNRLNEQDIEIT